MAFQRELEREVKRLVGNGALAQGYIFFGEDQSVQATFARSLSAYLERREWDPRAAVLIDAWVITEEGDQLGIEVSRSLQKFLWQKPFVSPRRTVIIPRAHRFTAHAQNAILKVTEEPPAHALIILTTPHLERLSPALLSRFPKLYFSERADRQSFLKHPALKPFLRGNSKERSELLKDLQEKSLGLEHFAESCLAYLAANLPEYAPQALTLLRKLEVMGQWNTNRRLQLEAALLTLPRR